ncbi:MAG: hypothetical protein IPN42_08245 [Methylococcaceae bacterium]|nr:hypothetical protein [Methylococcaceae bacterium]
MKTIKTIVLSSLIALSMGAFSTVAFAEVDPGRTAYAPADAIDLVLGQIKKAEVAIQEGKPAADVYAIIKQGTDYSKEVNANDVVDRARAKANDILKKARTAAKEGDLKTAAEFLPPAEKAFADLKPLI